MMSRAKEITLYAMVDREEKILFITRHVAKNLYNLASPEAKGYFIFKNMFPDFKEVVVPTLGTVIEE